MPNPTDPTPDGLPPLPPPPPPPPADDEVPMALTDLDEAAEDVPAAEVVDSAVGFDLPDLGGDKVPPFPPVSPGDSWATDDDAAAAVPYGVPEAAPASSSALFDDAPPAFPAEPVSGGVSASSLFGESVPTAEPASGSGFIPAAEAAGDSAVNVDAAPPVAPVAPASGWFAPEEAPPSAHADGIEAELAGPLPAGAHGEGSDIFASAPPPASRLLADQSDVIAATAWRDAEPFTPAGPKGGGRSSDVALTFDQPPGGSTIQEPSGADDLPVADEVPEAEAQFGDSATLAHTPPLPGADAPDLDADASSIFAALSEPAGSPSDGSVVRWDDPGVEPTMSDQPRPGGFRGGDRTEADDAVDLGAAGSGSGLFADSRRTGPRFELTPDAPGTVDPFGGIDEGEEPSLGSARSSIFTGPPAGESDLPTGEAEAVEFSDHPDPAAAAGAIDFGLADEATYPNRTRRAPISEDDALDVTDPDRLPNPSTGNVPAAAGNEDAGLDWLTGPNPTDTSGVPPAVPQPASGALSRSRLAKPQNADLSSPTDPGFSAEPAAPVRAAARPPVARPSAGSVEIDWMAESGTSELVLAEPSRVEPPGRRTPAPVDDDDDDDDTGLTRLAAPVGGGRVNRGAGVGLLLGLLLGGGVASGVYFSGVLDQGTTKAPPASAQQPTNPGGAPTPTPTPVAAAGPVTVSDARAALEAGDPARALKAIEAAGATTTEAKAARGQARLLARLREAAAPAADDAALKDARADLEAVVADADAAKSAEGERAAVRAAVHLGLTHELAGDRAKAREVYAAAAAKFPKAADVFQAALDRLDATAPPAAPAGATSLRLTPADAERLAVAAAFLFVQDAPAPAAEPAEAGGQFWRAANLAAAGKYAEAADAIDRAKAAHQTRARALAGRGLNPLTDPLEQIFPRTCDDLKAYWELRRTLYEHKGIGALVRAEGVGKALDTVAGYKTERDTARADAKLAGEKLASAQKGLLAEQEALKTEKAALKTEKELSAKLTDDLKKAAAEILKEKTTAATLVKEVEATKKQADELTTKAKALDTALATAEKGRKDADATLAGVAAELKAAKLLPEKHAPADVVAAAKSAASRATGPDLTSLIPPGAAATFGAPATTATLVDLAARAGKLDAAAKQAAADLAAANAKYRTDFAKTKADYDAATKAAADAHATALKKATDEADKALTKTKADALAELTRTKTAADTALTKTKAEAAAAATKLKADYDAAVTRLNADHKAATAALEKKAADDAAAAKAALAAAEKRHRDELGDAVSPAEALPLWLPVLTELRRPADADPALAAAARVLKTAPPASEDAARAHAVAGLALALKRDLTAARDRFEAAKRSPAYAPDKDWARAADVGLASLTDPAAASRVAVAPAPGKDAAAAARSLGAGIAAYSAGQYAAAERALADAARLDPADGPLAWYFLGAARWAAGNAELAREDFRQGADRERRGGTPARVIGAAIAPIQGPARAALDAARP